jgi:hypothetical protein
MLHVIVTIVRVHLLVNLVLLAVLYHFTGFLVDNLVE